MTVSPNDLPFSVFQNQYFFHDRITELNSFRCIATISLPIPFLKGFFVSRVFVVIRYGLSHSTQCSCEVINLRRIQRDRQGLHPRFKVGENLLNNIKHPHSFGTGTNTAQNLRHFGRLNNDTSLPQFMDEPHLCHTKGFHSLSNLRHGFLSPLFRILSIKKSNLILTNPENGVIILIGSFNSCPTARKCHLSRGRFFYCQSAFRTS